MAENTCRSASSYNKRELDSQHLNHCFSNHYHQDDNFLTCWYFQLLENVLEHKSNFSTSTIEQKQPSRETHVDYAKQHADHVGCHRVTVKTYNLRCFAGETQTAKKQTNHCRNDESHDVEDTETDADHFVVVAEVVSIVLVNEDIVDCTADKNHRGIEPERAVAELKQSYRSYYWLRGSKNPPVQNLRLSMILRITSLFVTLK